MSGGPLLSLTMEGCAFRVVIVWSYLVVVSSIRIEPQPTLCLETSVRILRFFRFYGTAYIQIERISTDFSEEEIDGEAPCST